MKVRLCWHDIEADVTWERDVDLPLQPFPSLVIGLHDAGTQDVTVMSVYCTDTGRVEATINHCPVSPQSALEAYEWEHDV